MIKYQQNLKDFLRKYNSSFTLKTWSTIWGSNSYFILYFFPIFQRFNLSMKSWVTLKFGCRLSYTHTYTHTWREAFKSTSVTYRHMYIGQANIWLKILLNELWGLMANRYSSQQGVTIRVEVCLVDQKQIDCQFSSVQSLSHVQLFATPWITAGQASHPSPTPRVHSNSCPSSWW